MTTIMMMIIMLAHEVQMSQVQAFMEATGQESTTDEMSKSQVSIA